MASLNPGRRFLWPMMLVCASIGVSIPLQTIYFRRIGLSTSTIALVTALPGIITILAGQFWGYLADVVWGRRKVLIITSIASAFAGVSIPFAGNVLLLSGVYLVHGFFNDSRMQLLASMMFAEPKGEHLFGRIRLWGTLAFIVTVLLLGWLADLPALGIAILFPILGLFHSACAVSLFPVREHESARRRDKFWLVQRVLMRRPVFRGLLVFLLIYQLPHNICSMCQTLLLDSLGATTLVATMPSAIAAMSETLVFRYGHRIAHHIRPVYMLAIASVMQIIRWGSIALFPIKPVILGASVLHLFTFGFVYYAALLIVNRETPARYRSSGQTLMGIVYSSLAAVLGNLVAAVYLFKSESSVRPWFAVAAVIAASSLLAWLPLVRLVLRRAKARASEQGAV